MELKTTVNPEAVETVSRSGWNFRPVQVEVTPDLVKAYFEDTPAAMSALLDHMLMDCPITLQVLLDEHRADFEDFVIGSVGEG